MKIIDQKKAVEILKDGGLVVLPTDTVYGVCADMSNIRAVKKVYELKGRSEEKPLIILVDSVQMVEDYVENILPWHRILMDKFWPGALSLLFRTTNKIPAGVNAGGDKIGVRMPNQEITLNLIAEFGGPIVATSVNRSGQPALKTIDEIALEFPDLAIVDGGDTALGVESTVLDIGNSADMKTVKILRLGAVSKMQIEDALGVSI